MKFDRLTWPQRVNWLAVASDLGLLACAVALVFACWLAVSIIFVIGD